MEVEPRDWKCRRSVLRVAARSLGGARASFHPRIARLRDLLLIRIMHPRTLIALFSVVAVSPSMSADWPAWRGPDGTGRTTETALPTKWGREENVKWRVKLPEPGNSTPVVAK